VLSSPHTLLIPEFVVDPVSYTSHKTSSLLFKGLGFPIETRFPFFPITTMSPFSGPLLRSKS